MAELTISPDDIQGAIEEYVSSFTAGTAREEVGTIIDTGDGIAHVEGLPSVMTQELLEFEGGVLGVALNLDEHDVGAVILGDFEKLGAVVASVESRTVIAALLREMRADMSGQFNELDEEAVGWALFGPPKK